MADRSMSGTSGSSDYRRMLAVVMLAVPLALAGCASGHRGTDPAAGTPSAILAAWRSFPVNADPRPPVLTGPTVLDPADGFSSDVVKEAYLTGRFGLAAELPAAPESAGGYPVISAKAALDRLQAAYPNATIKGARPLPTLRIVAAALGQAAFDTDRGPRRLPAWRFSLDRFTTPVWVLAVGPEALWTGKPTAATDLGFRVTPDPDGRTLRLDFVGGPDEATPCGLAYNARAVESATAAVIRLESKPQRPASGDVACDAVGYRRTVTLRLAAPLGGRVLLTPYGVPLSVPAS